jgi:hypothetical protein
MTRNFRVLSTVGILASIVLIGLAVGWLGSRQGPEAPPPAVSAEPTSTPPLKFAKTRLESAETPVAQTNEPAPSGAATNLVIDWEGRLDHILGAEGTESDKAKRLLELFPNLPENGQVEVAQHLSNLLGDQDYAPMGSFLTNSALPEPVLDVLMADLLNRPNSIKLPLILEVARDPQHPKATEAKDLLEIFLDENFDQDWAKWQAKIDQWLKDNPD